MQTKYIKHFAAALTALAFISPLTFAADGVKNSSFEKDTWQYVIIKSAKKVLKEQKPLIKKEEALKLALKEEEAKPFSLEKFSMKQKQAKPKPSEKTPTQSQMDRSVIFSLRLEELYNKPGYEAEGKKIAAVYSELKEALIANELFKYYHLDRNRFSDFAALSPAGVAFVKDVFKSLQEGRQPSVKPYRAEVYKTGAVLVYFKDIPGEPIPVTLEFYPQETVVVLIAGGFGRYYGELATVDKELKL